jgi:hypothetical protein
MTSEKAEFLLEQMLKGSKDLLLVVGDRGRPLITDRADGREVVSKIRKKKCPLRQRTKRRCRSGCPLCPGGKS